MKIIPTTPLTDVYFSDSHVKPESIFLPYFVFDKKYERISIEKIGLVQAMLDTKVPQSESLIVQ
jgi:hypothetical protein